MAILSPVELEAFRRLLFFSVPEAAEMLGYVSEQAWRRWEAGTRKIPADVEQRVREVLGWRVHYIESLRKSYTETPHLRPYPLLWYSSRTDFPPVEGTGLVLWRVHQSACALLLDELKERVQLVLFDRSPYSVQLASQNTEAMIQSWDKNLGLDPL